MAQVFGVLFVLGLLYLIKTVAYPILANLNLEVLRGMTLKDVMLLFEVIVLLVILGGFVLEEIIKRGPHIATAANASPPSGARWGDLAYLFVAVFGSGALYVALGHLSGGW